MLSLHKLPTRAKSVARLAEADHYCAQLWLLGANFVNKTIINKKFGRNQANMALARYFVTENRGSNVSKKLTEIRPKDLDDLPEDRQTALLKSAVEQNIEVAITDVVEEPPTDYDRVSIICTIKENVQQAVNWCIDNRKFQYIKPVRILMARQFWKVYYREKSSRYYAIWPFCLTNWPSALRKIILSGVDYDLINSIGQFILEKAGSEIDKYPLAKSYLLNSKETRKNLVDVLGITETQAKKILHATTNGASITQGSIVNGKSALLEIVNQSQALEYVTKFCDLVEQVKNVRKIIAKNNKEFMNSYFVWEQQKTGTIFSGTGLIMHDGIDGCSISTVIPPELSDEIKMSESRSVWDTKPIIDTLITM